MPKPSNPLLAIAKKLYSLKAKSEKLAQEIADFSAIVTAEASKAQSTAPAPAAKKPSPKTVSVPSASEPKKRGRPAKINVSEYL